MKKTLSLILSAVLIISTLITLIIPTSAEGEGEGNWDVMLSANSVDQDDMYRTLLPGYHYDETGFHTISPNYIHQNPKFTVISKEMYDVTNFSMTIVVHDYCVTGDNWLSFSVWSESNGLAQGDVSGKYGDGWTSLMRADPSTGKINRFESWNQTKGGRNGRPLFTPIDDTQLNPVIFDEIINDDGDRVITFSIEDGVVKINGQRVGAGTDNCIAKRFPEGFAYVGVTLHNTDNTGTYFPTISIVDVNGKVPGGSGYRKAQSGSEPHRPPFNDINKVPYGQPAIWFDATLENTNRILPQHTGCNLTWADDNKSFLINLEQDNFQIDFIVPDDILYKAEELTCFAIIFKNFCACDIPEGQTPFTYCHGYSGNENAKIRCYSGSHYSLNDNVLIEIQDYFCINPVDENGNSLVDDYYTVAIFEIDNPEYWENRIHGFRLEVEGLNNYDKEGHGTMEILGAGFFRAPMEAVEYIGNMQVDGQSFNVKGLTAACWDCVSRGHYDAGNGDELCDACWTATRRCDGCGRLVEFYFYDHCEHCGYLEICDDKIHVDEDNDNYCDSCYDIINIEETTTQPIEIPDTETESTESTTEEASSKETSDDELPPIIIAGCELSASLGIISIVSIIGAGILIKKKED